MYSRILIATDGSELATKGLDQGLALAQRLGASVTVVTVTEPWVAIGAEAAVGWSSYDNPIAEYQKACAASAKEILDAAAARAKSAGVTPKLRHVADHYPADGIVTAAAEESADLIVVASHGRKGLGRLLLGSQASQVLTQAKQPVLVIK